MFNPFRREIPVCPECKTIARVGHGRCVWCGTRVHVPIAYFRWLWFLDFLILGALGIPTFTSHHAGTWLLTLLMAALPVRIVLGIAIPPWFDRGPGKENLPFIFWYALTCLASILYWTLLGWLHLGLGATRAELNENWDAFSVPLGFISSGFVIRSDKWLSDVFGIIMGNSFFEALGLFFVYRVVRARLNRGRAIRLNITDSDSDET